jgi:predicted enzyme related to lactoylglutathione lyase
LPRVIHFEINADEPERAKGFYEKVFGWKIVKWEGPVDYWLIQTGEEPEPGIDGAITKREFPGATIFNTIGVPSIDEFMKKIEENGGTIVVPKMSVPGVGYAAYFKDTEGNTFGLMEEDTSAE